jgi:hypothetical protein
MDEAHNALPQYAPDKFDVNCHPIVEDDDQLEEGEQE